jgi:chorismate synthase
MSGNGFGTIFRLTSFGESHGPYIGGVIEGCPANEPINIERIQQELNRRKPGQSKLTTDRLEADRIEFISGIFEGKSTGMPIAFLIPNTNQQSKDYSHLKEVYRPSHADFTWHKKYGIRDYKGGGRSSARETAARVVGGAIAKQMLEQKGILFETFTVSIGEVKLNEVLASYSLKDIEASPVRCPSAQESAAMVSLVKTLKEKGDSTGGVILGRIRNLPVGLGNPVFDRLEADLAKAMMSINASKGFEIGSGFKGSSMKGSIHNDPWIEENGIMVTSSNHSGGVQGGISNGMDIEFRVAFKPVATVAQKQKTIDLEGKPVALTAKGRHDPCVVPRAVPIVEAMAAMVILDHVLLAKSIHL